MRLAKNGAVLDNRDTDTSADVHTSGTGSSPEELHAQRQPGDTCQGNLLPHRDRRNVQTQVRDQGLGRRMFPMTPCSPLHLIILFSISALICAHWLLLAATSLQVRSQTGFSMDLFILDMAMDPSRFAWVRPSDAVILIANMNGQRWICRSMILQSIVNNEN